MFIIHFFHCDSHLAAKPDFLGNLSKKVIESRYIGPKVRAVIDWMGSYPFNIPYNIMIWLLIAIFATKITRMMGHLLFAGFQLPGGRRSVTYTAVWHRCNSFMYVHVCNFLDLPEWACWLLQRCWCGLGHPTQVPCTIILSSHRQP